MLKRIQQFENIIGVLFITILENQSKYLFYISIDKRKNDFYVGLTKSYQKDENSMFEDFISFGPRNTFFKPIDFNGNIKIAKIKEGEYNNRSLSILFKKIIIEEKKETSPGLFDTTTESSSIPDEEIFYSTISPTNLDKRLDCGTYNIQMEAHTNYIYKRNEEFKSQALVLYTFDANKTYLPLKRQEIDGNFLGIENRCIQFKDRLPSNNDNYYSHILKDKKYYIIWPYNNNPTSASNNILSKTKTPGEAVLNNFLLNCETNKSLSKMEITNQIKTKPNHESVFVVYFNYDQRTSNKPLPEEIKGLDGKQNAGDEWKENTILIELDKKQAIVLKYSSTSCHPILHLNRKYTDIYRDKLKINYEGFQKNILPKENVGGYRRWCEEYSRIDHNYYRTYDVFGITLSRWNF